MLRTTACLSLCVFLAACASPDASPTTATEKQLAEPPRATTPTTSTAIAALPANRDPDDPAPATSSPSPPMTPSASCPQVHPPAPGFCKDGSRPLPHREATTGCITRYQCALPKGPAPQMCPEIHPPAPGFCKDGSKPQPVRNSTGCVIRFKCHAATST
jgi:hypothetical protein